MAEPSSRTLTCSVLYAELADDAQLPLGEQASRRRRLAAQIAQELMPINKAERVVHEIGRGTAVAFLADVEAALAVAIGLLTGGGPAVRLGLGFGTVHVLKDLGGQATLAGEGVNEAQRVAALAAAGQALAAAAYREVTAPLSPDHAAVFHPAPGGEPGLYEVRIPGAEPAPAPAERPGRDAASVFDAGPHLMISGYDRAAVQKALEETAAKGGRIISPITKVGDKWMASCEHPAVRLSECKVEKFGLTTMVTGPTREAVQRKVEELVELGARLRGEIEQDGDAWAAVCDADGTGG